MEEINKAYATFRERDRTASVTALLVAEGGQDVLDRETTRKRQDDCTRTYRDVAR